MRGASLQAVVLKAMAQFMSKRGKVKLLLKVQSKVLVQLKVKLLSVNRRDLFSVVKFEAFYSEETFINSLVSAEAHQRLRALIRLQN